ncbi:TB2/DP1, HVA22 family-domain-containing protein [Abortiporus biennis]|nr:TB2/DP1, HVA22 family-domain-containing protein [Abortiporus biennis]
MFFYLTFRIVSAVVAFLYPGYASYKTLSQRPASEAELERWLMYWSVLGCIVGVEYVAEWLISWFPFYYPLKTLFLLYLALPQTAGSSYLYKTQVQPFFSTHESEIDSALSQLRTVVYNYLQQLIRSLWAHVSATLGQQPQSGDRSQTIDALDEGGLTGEAALNSGATPALGDPVSGPVQLAQTFWRSYGPGILASGVGLLAQAQQSLSKPPSQPQTGSNRVDSSKSVNDRRRQLEAELASLSKASSSSVQGYDVDGPVPVTIPPANNPSRSSSSSSLLRERNGGNSKSTFEEVEVPSDMEGDLVGHPVPERPSQAKRNSWFWGSNQGKGYERVKSD